MQSSLFVKSTILTRRFLVTRSASLSRLPSLSTLLITGIIGALFLAPACVLGQDLEIEKLKQENQRLLTEIEKLKLSNEKLSAEFERQRKENAQILDAIKKSNAEHLQAIQDLIKLKNELITAEIRAKSSDERAQQLLQRVKELELILAKKQVDGGKKIEAKAALNPPAVLVKGSIEKVDAKDRTLVSISIGSDGGLARDHTLEVFRLKPTPMYLGVIRIVDVTPQKAVGRLMRPADARPIVLQVGDQVTSRFGPEEPKKKE
jgi:hypothetical protein